MSISDRLDEIEGDMADCHAQTGTVEWEDHI